MFLSFLNGYPILSSVSGTIELAAGQADEIAAALASGATILPDGAGYTVQPRQMTAAEALAALKRRRDAVIAAGSVDADGLPILTDDLTQQRLTAVALAATLDPAIELRWKCADGVFRTVSAAQITAAAQAVRTFVQACFDREAELAALISAAADPSAVDITTGWPA